MQPNNTLLRHVQYTTIAIRPASSCCWSKRSWIRDTAHSNKQSIAHTSRIEKQVIGHFSFRVTSMPLSWWSYPPILLLFFLPLLSLNSL